MSRPPSPLVAQRHAARVQRSRELQAAPPVWGCRRLWASLHGVEPRPVHKKRLRRRLREPQPLGQPHLRLTATRTPAGRTPPPTQPHAWWGLEMPQVLGQRCGWVSRVVGLEWDTKASVGDHAGRQSPARHGLAALAMAGTRQVPAGGRAQGWSRMRAHGGQPTSTACMQAWGTLGLHQALTRDHNPRGHADTARVRRTRKEECRWPTAWTCPRDVRRAREDWSTDGNAHDCHAALGDKPPGPLEREDHFSHGTQWPAA